MPSPIRPIRLNHMNLVLEDIETSVAGYRALYDADLLMDMPQREFHACLIDVGRTIFEIFAPHAFLLNSRYGPHYLGVEYQADMDEVREAIASHGLRIVRDIGLAVHTDPADGFGVAFEFYAGCFHDRDWEPLGGGKMKPAAYWRDEHALGISGLKGYSLAVWDIDAAAAFLKSFLNAEPVYEAPRPAIAGRALGLKIADAVVELQTPVGGGALEHHLRTAGQGIRSTQFAVRDLGQARAYFAEREITLEPGAAPDSLAAPAKANLGVMFEFSE